MFFLKVNFGFNSHIYIKNQKLFSNIYCQHLLVQDSINTISSLSLWLTFDLCVHDSDTHHVCSCTHQQLPNNAFIQHAFYFVLNSGRSQPLPGSRYVICLSLFSLYLAAVISCIVSYLIFILFSQNLLHVMDRTHL